MYMKDPGESVESVPSATPMLQVALIGSAVMTLVLGILPGFVLDFANKAAQ
jgi:NADH:ubiquinone oxidoreductase subunit 2 (subunit N)